MLSKQALEALKSDGLHNLYVYLRNTTDSRELLFILENLGYLPDNFDGEVLLPLLEHESSKVRFWAIKNLGKIKTDRYQNHFINAARSDIDSMVRREAVSSIGRMRNEKAVPDLIHFLADPDPKVVLQAVRGLLVFKRNPDILEALRPLCDHPNEIVQATVAQEFAQTNGKTDTHHVRHADSPACMRNMVVQGDVRATLEYVPDESIHLTFTSPPYYNARDYSIYESYNAYLDFLEGVFSETHRITKEGRFLIVNTSPVIIPRVSRSHSSKRYPIPFDLHARLVKIGWEFIDDIVWAKPEVTVKNRNAGFLQHRKPLAYKPNAVTEYLMVYRKQTDKLIDWNIHQYVPSVVEESKVPDGYETTNLWKIDPTYDRVHSAVFPTALCNRVISYYSFKGDLVFDPFAGSGTVGRAAHDLERYFFLTEQEPQYVERMKQDLGQAQLFGNYFALFLSVDEFKKRVDGK